MYSTALYDGVYKQVGRMISVCLVHGGVKPQFFSERLYRQVCALQPPVTDIAEINDYNFREKLTKVLDTVNGFLSLMLLLSYYPVRFYE